MAASINDLATRASNGTRPSPTTLTALRSVSATTITVSALTGWPTATAVHFIIYRIDSNGLKIAGSQTDWKGVVSGSTITGLVLKAGTDVGDGVGAIVEAAPTAAWADDNYAAITKDHDSQGRHAQLTDTNGNAIIALSPTVSAVNEVSIANAVTTAGPTIAAVGTDTNIDLNLTPKGTGKVAIAAGKLSTVALVVPYKFSVYRSASQSGSSGSFVKINFDTKIFDTGTNYDATTNFRFTAPVAGFYQFNAAVAQTITASNIGSIALYKNGAVAFVGNTEVVGPVTAGANFVVSGLLQLASTDYVEVFAYGTGSAFTTTASTTYFQGYLVSST